MGLCLWVWDRIEEARVQNATTMFFWGVVVVIHISVRQEVLSLPAHTSPVLPCALPPSSPDPPTLSERRWRQVFDVFAGKMLCLSEYTPPPPPLLTSSTHALVWGRGSHTWLDWQQEVLKPWESWPDSNTFCSRFPFLLPQVPIPLSFISGAFANIPNYRRLLPWPSIFSRPGFNRTVQ